MTKDTMMKRKPHTLEVKEEDWEDRGVTIGSVLNLSEQKKIMAEREATNTAKRTKRKKFAVESLSFICALLRVLACVKCLI